MGRETNTLCNVSIIYDQFAISPLSYCTSKYSTQRQKKQKGKELGQN